MMEEEELYYQGQLYGKLGDDYFPLQETAKGVELLKQKVEELGGTTSFRAYCNKRIENMLRDWKWRWTYFVYGVVIGLLLSLIMIPLFK